MKQNVNMVHVHLMEYISQNFKERFWWVIFLEYELHVQIAEENFLGPESVSFA